MAEILNKVIFSLGGLILGLCLPWVRWEIEKRRIRRDDRRQLVKECRTLIDKDTFDVQSFIETSCYSRIRTELSETLRNEIEHLQGIGKQPFHVVMGGRDAGVNVYKGRLLDEISKIEKSWKLL